MQPSCIDDLPRQNKRPAFAGWAFFVPDAAGTGNGQTASLSSLEARKATFLLALIWIGSPVGGLRPIRAARLRTTRTPRPTRRVRAPFFGGFVTRSTRSAR